MAFERTAGTMKRSLAVIAIKYGLAGIGFALMLFAFAALCAPDLQPEIPAADPEELAAARESRDVSIENEEPLTIIQDVDYREGRNAAWWPTGESPLLRELVESGDLPPVEERVGPEPCVMEGVEGIILSP